MQLNIEDTEHFIRFEEMDAEELTMDIFCSSDEAKEKLEKILFVAGIQKNEKDDERTLVCKIDTETKFKRFIKTVCPWLGLSPSIVMSSPLFKRFLRNIEKDNENDEISLQ